MQRLSTLIFAALMALSGTAWAQTLYAVSVRTYSDASYTGIEGNIYTVDPGTANAHLVSSLRTNNGTPVGLDGLAIHPKSGVFYGITAATSKVIPRSLVTVDPQTGEVTPVGDLGLTGSDIAFDSEGTLFVWLPDTRQLGTTDLSTGKVTPRGPPIGHGAVKGGLATIGPGRVLVASSGGSGTLDSVDTNTGVTTTGPALKGAPFPDLINGLAYSPAGVLYAINTINGPSSPAKLVIIDIVSGEVTNVGTLPSDTDALTFGPSPALSGDATATLQDWRKPAFAILLAIALGIIFVAWRSKER